MKNKQLKGVCKVGACKCDHLQEDVVNDEICPKRFFLSCDVKQTLACLSENAFSLSLSDTSLVSGTLILNDSLTHHYSLMQCPQVHGVK